MAAGSSQNLHQFGGGLKIGAQPTGRLLDDQTGSKSRLLSCNPYRAFVGMARPHPKATDGLEGRVGGLFGGRERVGGSRRPGRLLELGVVRGETITLQRAAPLGDPLEFVVKGYHLSLRKREAATILVEALEVPARSADAA